MVQRQVLYLGEINGSQQEAWCRVIEVFDEEAQRTAQLALFPADRPLPDHAEGPGVQIRLGAMAAAPAAAVGRVLACLPAL